MYYSFRLTATSEIDEDRSWPLPPELQEIRIRGEARDLQSIDQICAYKTLTSENCRTANNLTS